LLPRKKLERLYWASIKKKIKDFSEADAALIARSQEIEYLPNAPLLLA
jgi:hypothetical protein